MLLVRNPDGISRWGAARGLFPLLAMIRFLTPSGRGYREYPPALKGVGSFRAAFPDETSCRDFLFRQRYPAGFTCEDCGGTRFEWLDSKRLICVRRGCRSKVSLTAGTILHGTRKPLLDWFHAAYLVSQRGTNARTLQRRIRLTYKVAWLWAQKLRRVLGTKTTLDAPYPPFEVVNPPDRGRPRTRVSEALHFANHGAFRWFFDRPGGLGECCERLTKADWDYPDRQTERDRWLAWDGGHAPRPVYDGLFRDYSGSLADKHLRAYFDEAELRVNYRKVPADRIAVELAARLAAMPPVTYREIVGPREERPPLWVWASAPPRRPSFSWERAQGEWIFA